jgi:hypothetical protein
LGVGATDSTQQQQQHHHPHHAIKKRNKLIGKCPHVKVKINGVEVLCLLDSGSEVSTITHSFYETYLKDTVEHLEDVKSWLKLKAGNGFEIPCVGLMEADVNLHGSDYTDIGILVVENPEDPETRSLKENTPGVIGCNLLQNIYEHEKKIQGNNFLELLKEQEGTQELAAGLKSFEMKVTAYNSIKDELNRKETDILGLVKTTPKLLIPAETGLTISGTTRQLPSGYQVLVEPVNSSLPPGLIVYPSVSKVERGRVKFQVRNYSKTDVIFHQSQRIAKISAFEECLPELNLHTQEKKISLSDHNEDKSNDQNTMLPPGLDMDLTGLTTEEQENFKKLIQKYSDVFSYEETDIGCTDTIKHEIHLTDDDPIVQADRRIPPHLIPEVKKILQQWMNGGIIKDSNSPFASQMVIVKKKCGSLRICIDYRQLNMKTIRDAFPLPRIEESLESLKNAKYFLQFGSDTRISSGIFARRRPIQNCI